MATVKFHVYEDQMVHAIYSDVVDAPLTEGITAAEIIAAMQEESAESGVEVPEMQELRALNMHCKPAPVAASEESASESGEGQKYLVRAVLRYVPVASESESM